MNRPPVQLTLVAWLGRQPDGLAALLAGCRRRLTRALGSGFEPYATSQIHATLIGLERRPGTRRDNANFFRLRNEQRRMDIAGFLAGLATDDTLPLRARFGGFERGERPFESRGATPYERSFSIQGDRAVLLGWPSSEAGDHPDTLSAYRRRAARYGILHAYHATPRDEDNDLYLRLGFVREPDPGRRASVEAELREWLAERPVTVPLTHDDLRVAAYRDPTLAPETTRAVSPPTLIDDDAIETLYGSV